MASYKSLHVTTRARRSSEPQRNRGPIAAGEPQRNRGSIATSPGEITSLRFVRDHLWRGLYHLNLRAHFLDLRGLLFELGRENLHPFLLLRDR